MRRWVLALLPLLLVACDDDDVTLQVRLRSDFAPGVEVSTALVRVEGPSPTERTASVDASDDLVGGVSLAELGVALGEHRVTVTLQNASGQTVGERTLLVQVRESQVVTAVITRSCQSIECPSGDDPAATECFGGRCVTPDCVPEADGSCPDPVCTTDAECVGATVSCLRGVCLDGACGSLPDATLCAPMQRCDVQSGCVSEDDPDAGSDAGLDAGLDAGPGLRSDFTLSGSFSDCPRTRPWCATMDANTFFFIDPTTGFTCNGPQIEIPPGHPISAISERAFALQGDRLYIPVRGGGGDSHVVAVDMATDAVQVDEVNGWVVEAIFADDAGGLAAQVMGMLRQFAGYDDLVATLNGGSPGPPLGMCTSTGGTLQYRLREGQVFGAWFRGTQVTTCDLATGAAGAIPLMGFDASIEGFDLDDSRIVVLSGQDLITFDRSGMEQSRVTVGAFFRADGLVCAL